MARNERAMTSAAIAPELQAILVALDEADADAREVAAGLTEAQGIWREAPGRWSVSECLDHLAKINAVYLAAMREPARRAQQAGRTRRRPARPGVIGRWFVRTMEPPVSIKMKAPSGTEPRPAPPLADALAAFLASQDDVRRFVADYGHLDLSRVRFPNPFVTGIRFSLATGLHVVPAHDRRHLSQAWRARRAAEQAGTDAARPR